MSKKISGTKLQLRDVVDLSEGQGLRYMQATVVKITNKTEVTLLRPYVVTGDFEYTGGVTRSLGFEEFTTHVHQEFTLVDRDPIKR